jgi:hypothetical protein
MSLFPIDDTYFIAPDNLRDLNLSKSEIDLPVTQAL